MKQAPGIIRSCGFDQVSFPLITNIYIQTVAHTVDVITICCSLLLQSQLCSCQQAAEAAINSDSFELQL